MRKYLTRIFFFVSVPTVIGILLFVVFVNYVGTLFSSYQMDDKTSSIYIGDSHIQMAINDKLVSGTNVASSSESFYFSYYKLAVILNSKNSITKVYLGLSYHNLSSYYDQFIYGVFSSRISPKYFYMLPEEEQLRLIYCQKRKLNFYLRGLIEVGVSKVVDHHFNPAMGGFLNEFYHSSSRREATDERLHSQFFTKNGLKPFSDLNIEYLNKIVALCNEKEVELYVISTPLSEYYNSQVPQEYKLKMSEIIAKHNIRHIDLTTMKMNEKCFVPDGDHVSILGAMITSKKMNDIFSGATSKKGRVN